MLSPRATVMSMYISTVISRIPELKGSRESQPASTVRKSFRTSSKVFRYPSPWSSVGSCVVSSLGSKTRYQRLVLRHTRNASCILLALTRPRCSPSRMLNSSTARRRRRCFLSPSWPFPYCGEYSRSDKRSCLPPPISSRSCGEQSAPRALAAPPPPAQFSVGPSLKRFSPQAGPLNPQAGLPNPLTKVLVNLS
jgi:hypothetical protein